MKIIYKTSRKVFFSPWLFALLCWNPFSLFSQCDVTTPSFIVDLSGSPDSVWIETNTTRLDSCCYQEDTDPCIMFIVSLPPNVGGLYFSVENPQPSISASQFHINCDSVAYSVQDTVCVAGYTPPYVITYCKPGNDKPDYIIAGIGAGEISPPIVVSDACSDTIFGTGFKESTIIWTSYPYNPIFQGFLSDSSGQDTVIVTPTGNYPDSVQYILCGELAGMNCSSGNSIKCDTTTVYFVTNFSVAISPQDPTICFGGGPATITANATGGAAPYSYLWNTGATTQSITVSSGNAGLYWVEVKDTLECAGVTDSVTVTEFTSSIAANAGPGLLICASIPSVTLNGSVQAASGGIWSGGAGTFAPDDTTLNAVYTPDASEISSGIAILTLTTTGNGTCPADSDSVMINISPGSVVSAGANMPVCANEGFAILSGTVSGGSSTGLWTTSGSGNFSPNDSALNATYNLSGADISSGALTLFLTSTNNGPCPAISDSIQITIVPAIVVNAGNDQTVCSNNSATTLSGSVTGPTTTGFWTTSGSGSFSPNDSDLTAIYQPSVGDTTTGFVVIVLTSSNNGNCNAVSDTVNIFIVPDITIANAGTDINTCNNTTGVPISGQVAGATGGIWSTLGSGTFFPSPDSLDAQYFPGGSDTIAGSASLVLSTVGDSGCISKTDTVQINFLASILINAGNDTAICFSDSSIGISGNVFQATGGTWSTSGNGTFFPNDSASNVTYFPGTDDYLSGTATLTFTSYGGCADVSDDLILNILPFANAGADMNVCATDTIVSLTGQSSNGASVQWTTSGTGNFSPIDTILNPTYIISSADITAGLVNLILSVSGITYGCSNATDTIEILISPPPYIFAGNDTSICSTDSSFNIYGIVLDASLGIWSTSGNGTFSPGDSSLNGIYFFGSSDFQTGSAIITLTGIGGCVINSDSLVLSIVPFANAGADQYLCSNDTIASLNGNATGSATFIWTTSGTGTFSPNDSTLNATYIISSADSTSGSVNLALSVSGANFGCPNTSDTVTIYILPPPVADAGADMTVCENNINISLAGTIVGALGGVWSTSGDGIFSPDSADLYATYSPGTNDLLTANFTISLTTTGSCVVISDAINVTITSAPTATAGPDVSVCSTIPVVSLNGIVTVASGGVWTTSGTGTFSPDANTLAATYLPGDADTAAGNVTIFLTTTGNGNCLAVMDSMNIIISPDLISAFAGNDTSVCTDSISLNGIVFNATGGTWSTTGGGNFTPSPSVLNPFYTFNGNDTAGGTVTLILTTTGNGNCLPKTDSMVVAIIGALSITISAADTFCANGGAIPLSANVSTGAGIWSTSGDGIFSPDSITLNANYLPGTGDTSSGNVTLVLVSSGNGSCVAVSDTLNIALIPGPKANFTTADVCHSEQVFFTDSTFPSNDIVSWMWDFGDGNSDSTQNSSHTYATDSSYSVTLTVVSNNGCIDSVSKIVTVHPFPLADFSGTAQCFVDSVYFSDMSVITSDSIVSWNWDLGDGNNSTLQTPAYFYNNSGSYIVTLIVSSDFGCSDSLTKTINVQPSPNANFINSSSCANEVISFTDASSVSPGDIISWNWDFGDGNTSNSQNPAHAYSTEETFIVTLVVVSDSGCSDTMFKNVIVFSVPEASFESSAQCFVDSVYFNDLSTITNGGIESWNWDFGDGNNSNIQNPAHFYSSPGSYSVTLIIVSDSGCADTVSQVFEVQPAPDADFGSTLGCLGTSTLFTDSSTISTGTIISWSWDFGDGNSSALQNPSHQYSFEGTFDVQLIAVSDSGCTDTIVKLITVYPSPVAGFLNNSQCTVDSVFLTDTSSISSGNIGQWSWDFGDGTISSTQNPSHFYSLLGNYYVTLIVVSDSGCSDTIVQLISVAPSPVADFIMSTNTVCLNQPILFADVSTIQSGSIASWDWDFGDGTASSSSNVFHSFSTSDTFTITLWVTSDLGCTDSISLEVFSFPSPISDFTSSGFCINEGTQFSNSSTANPDTIISWQWYFGDGGVSFLESPGHFYPSTGDFGVSLITTTNHGCKDTVTQVVSINPMPAADFSIDKHVALTGDVFNFSNNSSGSLSWIWDFGDSSGTSSAQNPDYTYSTGGTFIILLIAENEFNCKDTAMDSVIVNVPPKVPNGFSPNGDGKNDLLFPMGGPFKQVEFKIYNNWGELIYLSENSEDGWDGKKNGIDQPMGVYIYILYAITEDGNEFNLHGDVTLLR